MTATTRRRWRIWMPAALIALGALGVITVGGLRGTSVRTFALEAPNQFPLVVLRPSQSVCEGPVRSPSAFDAVSIWGASTTATAQLTVTARAVQTNRTLTSGPLTARKTESEQRVHLNRPVAAEQPIQICVGARQGAFSLAGSPAVAPGIVMTGKPAGHQFSLLLLSAGDRSLFGSLGLAFARAALFRPSWVGVWTYWALVVGLLVAVAVTVVAVASASAADEGDARGHRQRDHEA